MKTLTQSARSGLGWVAAIVVALIAVLAWAIPRSTEEVSTSTAVTYEEVMEMEPVGVREVQHPTPVKPQPIEVEITDIEDLLGAAFEGFDTDTGDRVLVSVNTVNFERATGWDNDSFLVIRICTQKYTDINGPGEKNCRQIPLRIDDERTAIRITGWQKP